MQSFVENISIFKREEKLQVDFKDIRQLFGTEINSFPVQEYERFVKHHYHLVITFDKAPHANGLLATGVMLLGVTQVVGGVALLGSTGFLGAKGAKLLISEGLSDMYSAAYGLYFNEFDGKQFMQDKALSLTLEAFTIGGKVASAATKVGTK